MLTRVEKQAQIDALKGTLIPAQGLFAMDFTGLSVGEITELRRRVRDANGSYVVVKNTLARIALAESSNASLNQIVTGPTAVAYTSGDIVTLAKALADFAKGHDKLKFRGGLVEGQLLDPKQANAVAMMPSKAELIARLLYLLQSPVRRLVVALNWPVRSLAMSVKEIANKQGTPAEA